MEKEQIELSYAFTGVKLLRILGIGALIFGVVCVFMTFGYWIDYIGADILKESGAEAMAWTATRLTAIVFFVAALCLALSTIARTSVYNRAILEQRYDFNSGIEKGQKG